MYPKSTLEHFVYGRAVAGDEDWRVFAHSTGLSSDDLDRWRSIITMELPPADSLQAVGLFAAPSGENENRIEEFALVRQRLADNLLLYHAVILPRDYLQTVAGNIASLLEITDVSISLELDETHTITALEILPTPTLTADSRVLLFNRLLSTIEQHDMTVAIKLLAAALDKRGSMLRGFESALDSRLELVQGLLMLLPSSARPALSFSTSSPDLEPSHARLIFSESEVSTERRVINVQDGLIPESALADEELVAPPYIQCLMHIWQGDVKAFVTELRTIDMMAARLMPEKSLEEGLAEVAQRYLLDLHVLSEGEAPIEQIKAVLRDDAPAPGPLRLRYVERLLHHALQERDSEAADLVALYMDEDTELDEALYERLSNELGTEPDAVYAFIRARLGQGVDDRWLERLRTAAVASMEVAINDSDTETLSSWLKLISREPAAYQLQEVFQQGLLAAQNRAHEDGQLGYRLISFAAKRAPDILDLLLDDQSLIAALPAPLGPALRDYEAEAVAAALALGREISLIILGRAAADAFAPIFTPSQIDALWSLYNDGQANTLPERYHPSMIMTTLVTEGADWLPNESLEVLLTRIISGGRAALFQQLCSRLAVRDLLLPLLSVALQSSGVSIDAMLNLVGQLAGNETLSPQQAVNTYLRLIANRNWEKSTLPLIEQIARTMQQNAGLTMPPDVLWRMVQIGSGAKSETVVRVASRRLLMQFESIPDDTALIDNIVRLYDQIQWTPVVRQQIHQWLRAFIHHQSTARLQAIDKAFEGKRALEEMRAIVQTTLAFRKMLGKRPLEDFANAIGTAYTILQAISDSFDPSNRPIISFDQATVRAELEARAEELTPDARKVLAKNLKELVQLIIALADNRSKATLIRREDDLERQLLAGEQPPQSAIDTMRWLSGYFSGMQEKPDAENGS